VTKSRDQVLFRSFFSPRLISPRLRLVARPRFFNGFALTFAVLCFGGVERTRFSPASSRRAVSLSANSLTSFLPICRSPNVRPISSY
jgi:cell division septal protein FtsQ